MLKSFLFIGLTLGQIAVLGLFFLSSADFKEPDSRIGLAGNRELVRHLCITDFAIWTEARYTRHPSQTDFFSPFQDFPSSLEHFPAGSVIAPVIRQETAVHD